ncbi:putative Kinase [Quillaja saponaria]|uniref:Kinase n=1 Tax=Quillaja saponaria TaxID=32244 RepID=A0AAD7LJU5_QUISA|nr:putative Kinase [Quillaja saponaria]
MKHPYPSIYFISTLLLTFFLIQEPCFAKKNQTCNPSSCGTLHNIRFPFRLKGDPKRCGLRRYELTCEDDVPVLALYSGKFNVQSINYNNYTIRLADPGVSDVQLQIQNHTSKFCFDAPSMPHYSLHRYNFSDGNLYVPYQYDQDQQPGSFRQILLSLHIIFLSCSNPVRDTGLYVAEADTSCLNGSSKGHLYAIAGSDLDSGHLKVGCQVKQVTMIFWNYSIHGDKYDNVSYVDIQNWMAYGFEISWLNGLCRYACGSGSGSGCSVNESTGSVQCANFCTYFGNGYNRCGLGIWLKIRELSKVLFPFLLAVTVTSVEAKFALGIISLIILLIFKWRRRHFSVYHIIEDLLQSNNNVTPIRYSYSQIRKMTKTFKERLGQGGFGTVYKGKLRSGQLVAVKILGKSQTNGQDFISEVATIGMIHHFDVVQLIGYCAEGSKRALIYEFMPHGSLDKYIFSKEEITNSVILSFERIYEISLGIARGIAYLHQGCDMQILHFDIKPHNILLDENFVPKVSDFGLAKLYPVDDSIVPLTAARGTLGYMAPELFYKNIGGVSYKADVYSFGKLLMEMAGRRKNLQLNGSRQGSSEESFSQIYFPAWIYNQFSEGNDIELMEDATEEEKSVAKKMIMVALWCIQLKPNDRPSMHQVVQMLEGEAQSLEMPPKPLMCPQDLPNVDRGFISKQKTADDSTNTFVEFEEATSYAIPENSESYREI